jgi:hypothetical protein
MKHTLWENIVTVVILLMLALSAVHNKYIIDQGKRLKQLEQAMAVYIKETK